MDDMKRAIYMLALEKISSGKEIRVCEALREAFVEITGYNLRDSPESEMIEILSEFFNLYDARLWCRWGDSIFFFSIEDRITRPSWWDFAWKSPRVRILNCILCHH